MKKAILYNLNRFSFVLGFTTLVSCSQNVDISYNKKDAITALNLAKTNAQKNKFEAALKTLNDFSENFKSKNLSGVTTYVAEEEEIDLMDATDSYKYYFRRYKIAYSYGEYLEAFECTKKLFPLGESGIHKAVISKFEGDCCRKFKLFSQAIDKYNIALTEVPGGKKNLQAGILHNEGLTYIDWGTQNALIGDAGKKEKYDLAIKSFDKAIGINSKNPLYYCAKAGVLFGQGEVIAAIENFDKAQNNLVAGSAALRGLSIANIAGIKENLEAFSNDLKKLSERAEIDDTAMHLTMVYMNRFLEIKENNFEIEREKIKDLVDRIAQIQSEKDSSYLFYHSFVKTFYDAYILATEIQSGALRVDIPLNVIATKLFKAIPLIGQDVNNHLLNPIMFLNNEKVKSSANNVALLCIDEYDLAKIAVHVVADFLIKKKPAILEKRTEAELKAWSNKFFGIENKFKTAELSLNSFGEKDNIKSMSKLGHIFACKLISSYVASGRMSEDFEGADEQREDLDYMTKFRINYLTEKLIKYAEEPLPAVEPVVNNNDLEGYKCKCAII